MLALTSCHRLLAGLLIAGPLIAAAATGAPARAAPGTSSGSFAASTHSGSASLAAAPSLHSFASRAVRGRAMVPPIVRHPGASAAGRPGSNIAAVPNGHHRSPTGSSSFGGTSTPAQSTTSSESLVIEQSSGASAQTQVPSPPVNNGRNPNLTGGTDPAIGQPSPPVANTFASSGGTAAPDHSGGGGASLAACMGFWEPATHMTKTEWRTTCIRTLNGIDLPVETAGTSSPHTGSAHAGRAHTRSARLKSQ
jgi:hypothetical protein